MFWKVGGPKRVVFVLHRDRGTYLSHREALKKSVWGKNEIFWVHFSRGRSVVVAKIVLLAPFSVIVDGRRDDWSQFSATASVELGLPVPFAPSQGH